MDLRMVQTEARVFANPLAQRIGQEANKPDRVARGEAAAFAGTAASMVLQTVTVSIALCMHPPASPEGEAFIRASYEAALRDAVERWHKSDLRDPRIRG